MVKVECEDCGSPYQIDEKRIPAAGLKMRCPRCGKSFLVKKEQAGGAAGPPAGPADLPAPRPIPIPAAPASAGIDLPAPAGARSPAPKPAAATPSIEIDLPEARPAAARPASAAPVELDLPAPAEALTPGLPAPKPSAIAARMARAAGVPRATAASAAASAAASSTAPIELDLPSTRSAEARPERPAPIELDRPAPAADPLLPASLDLALAAPAASASFLDLELPSPAADLPSAASARNDLPAAASSKTELPSLTGFGELDLPLASADELDLGAPPGPAPGAGGPGDEWLTLESMPPPELAGAGEPLELALEDEPPPRPPPPAAPPPRPPAPPLSFDAIELDTPARAPEPPASAAAPARPLDAGGLEGGLGEDLEGGLGGGTEIELAPGKLDAPGALVEAPPPPRERAPVSHESDALALTQRRRRARIVGACVSLAVVAGGALTLVPDVGPFGYYAIRDRIRAPAEAAELEALRGRAQAELDADTFTAAVRAVDMAKAAQAASPRYEPLAAYTAYLVYAVDLRFGKRPAEEAEAKALLATAEDESGEVVDAALARAAEDALGGNLARARQAAARVGERRADVDVLALLGEIDLASRANDKAKETFARAVKAHASARTLFGRARAELAFGDARAAEATAREVLKASPKHVGARVLIAQIAAEDPAREGEARELLAEVTGDGEKKPTLEASDRELVSALTLLGRLHLARSRLSAAETAFATAVKRDPTSAEALVGQGELYYQQGRFSEAMARFDAAIAADADSVAAKIGAARSRLGLERLKEAKDILRKLREARPKDAHVAYWSGRAEEAAGNKKEAEASYETAIKVGGKGKDAILAYVALAHLYAGLGRPEDASKRLAEAEAKFAGDAALLRARGDVALASGRYDEAKGHFEAALAKEEDLGTRFKLGVTLRRARLFEEAARAFDKVAQADKDFPGLAIERGLLFEQTGQSERALDMYADALRKAPDDVDLKLRVGSTQVVAGHAEQAEPVLREVLKRRPNSAEANHFLGRALLVRGTGLAEAMRFLERAVDIDPNRAEYHLYVGWGANETGQVAKAEASLAKALELDRELGDAYWQRAVLLQKQGRAIDALADLAIALEKRPSRHEAYATMALCHQDQSRFAEAEAAWRKAIAADDSVAEWHYRLGKLYVQRSNRAGAGAELERAVSLATSREGARPAWLFDAHYLLAESLRAAGQRDSALTHYRKYLDLAPRDHAYRADAEKALESLGAPR